MKHSSCSTHIMRLRCWSSCWKKAAGFSPSLPSTEFLLCFFKKVIYLSAGVLCSPSTQNTLNTPVFMCKSQITFNDGEISLSVLCLVTVLWIGKASCPKSQKLSDWNSDKASGSSDLPIRWFCLHSLCDKLWIFVCHMLLEQHRRVKH